MSDSISLARPRHPVSSLPRRQVHVGIIICIGESGSAMAIVAVAVSLVLSIVL